MFNINVFINISRKYSNVGFKKDKVYNQIEIIMSIRKKLGIRILGR